MADNNEGASKRKNLGMVFINTNKEKPTSFDIKGSCVFNGQKIRLGGYKKVAKAGGKLAEGTEFFSWYRVEPFEEDGGDPAATVATDFEPSKLEA